MNRTLIIAGMACVLVAFVTGGVLADDIMGEYKGTFFPDSQVKMDATAKVVSEGSGKYRIAIKAKSNDPTREGACVEVYGKHSDQSVLIDNFWAGGYPWKGEIKNGRLSLGAGYGLHFELDKIESKSPNAELKPPAGAIILLPYIKGVKADLSAWTNKGWNAIDDGVMECAPKKGSNKTEQSFGDIKQLHLEFKLPLEPSKRGQGRANSGVYLSDAYEVQILDSFGLVHTSGDCGGIYNVKRASVNACLPPETWQTYDITFRSPRFDESGKVKELPRITVIHNGEKIQDLEIPKARNREKGPIQLQDHGHKIQFRNIWLVEG